MKFHLSIFFLSTLWATSAPIPLQNPGVELNSGTDNIPISDPSLMGWGGDAFLSEGDTDYGNGRWKILFDDSGAARQLSTHKIETGAAYSIRFDAALGPDTSVIPPNAIVGGALLNGDFNADNSDSDLRSFNDTPNWFNLSGNQNTTATTLTGSLPAPDNSRNAALTDDGNRLFAIKTGYTLTADQKLELSYQWRDGENWSKADDEIQVTLFTTSDDTPSGTRSDIESVLSGTSSTDAAFESFKTTFAPIPASADGKKLFVLLEGIDGNASPDGQAEVDDFVISLFNPLLIGPGLRNGDFTEDTSLVDSRTFEETPHWTNLGAGQGAQATRTNLPYNGTRTTVLNQTATQTVFANDSGHTLVTGDVPTIKFVWRDASSWNDSADRVATFLYTTSNDDILGSRTILQTILAPLSTRNNTWEEFTADFNPIPASAAGKRLFVAFRADDGDGATGFGRVADFRLSVNDNDPAIPPAPPEPSSGDLIAEAYVDNGGTPQVIASQSYTLTSERVTKWNHYHLAIPAATLDAHAGKEIGVRFRGPGGGDRLSRCVDNVRLDHYLANLPDGSFTSDWDSSPDRVWPGPGYWGNRLQDWEVRNGRVNCIHTSKPRRALHRVGTSMRGNGGAFALSVRTGIHSGTIGTNARSGFLIGAGPNLDWKGSLLVHDGLGRDFGTFLGINNNGAAIIEDMSEGATTLVASGANQSGGFPSAAKITLIGSYNPGPGTYTLTISSLGVTGNLISQASTEVPSDRILGSFGLMSNRSTSGTSFWFDNFTGAGDALQPEPDRSLAIIGAMHTLHHRTLRLTAQLAPVDLPTTPNPTLEIFNGTNWNEIANAPIDNTDSLSSYNATFEIPSWNDTRDTDYRVGVQVDGETYYWEGTIRKDPVEKNEIVVINTSCQRISDGSVEADTMDWSPVKVWHPHLQTYDHIAKHGGDVLLALGDQIYEGQPTSKDTSSDFNRHYDYLYKWFFWMLQTRDLTKDMPTIAIPDDHDVYQGNLWGEGGIATNNQTTGGYEQPPSWVRLVERCQTRHMPLPDPYNAIQPAPFIAQEIGVYFTGMTYGEVGFAILEDRKFKTGPNGFPVDLNQQFLLGDRQKDFLKSWNTDWEGQEIKCVVSQSPLGMLHTHAASGYNFGLNDRDAHGWPQHRREEAWEILRQSRSFQLAGDQHLSTLVHHGVDGPADAGYSFTSPAISNFFPRVWDPVHNSGGRTATVSPYKGDFYLDGNGTLPTGQSNITSNHPGHIRIVSAANPLEYYDQTRNIDPVNLHDRGAGYGIIRIKKDTRQITFECWPIHADPEFPQTGSQFPDWPVTIHQAENDGRSPTGFLPVIETHWKSNPVLTVFRESNSELLYAMRFAGNLVRLPVYDNSDSYRVEISYGNSTNVEVLEALSPISEGPAAIHSFSALQPSIISGEAAILQWNVEGATNLTIDNGIGQVTNLSINGVGHVAVSPLSDTTYTLTLNGTLSAQTTVRVFSTKAVWLGNNFSTAELQDEAISGNDADPDGDGLTNQKEFNFQTNPRSVQSIPLINTDVVSTDPYTLEFTSAVPLQSGQAIPSIEFSSDLENWSPLSPLAVGVEEVSRNNNPSEGTTQVTIRVSFPEIESQAEFFRGVWQLDQR